MVCGPKRSARCAFSPREHSQTGAVRKWPDGRLFRPALHFLANRHGFQVAQPPALLGRLRPQPATVRDIQHFTQNPNRITVSEFLEHTHISALACYLPPDLLAGPD